MRLAATLVTLLAALCAPATPAAAHAAGARPMTGADRRDPATSVCVISDPRAVELSGLVATPDGYVSVIDSQWDADTIRIIYLDRSCRVTRTQGYPTPARDPEDVAIGPDGALWVADTGDNFGAQSHRQTVALWRVAPGGDPVIHRLSYPDGPHDAEALLFTGAGVPVIVTKEISGVAGIYEPVGPLQPGTATGVAMVKVGEFRPPGVDDANPLASILDRVVTGAATSPDRRRVALRTYTLAYEWDVPDGDVVKAITSGTPRITPLPDEPQGEAIAYTLDGADFLTLSDESGPTTVRRYHPSTQTAPASPSTSASPVAANTPAQPSGSVVWYAATAAGAGLALAVAGVVGLRRARRRPRHAVDADL